MEFAAPALSTGPSIAAGRTRAGTTASALADVTGLKRGFAILNFRIWLTQGGTADPGLTQGLTLETRGPAGMLIIKDRR